MNNSHAFYLLFVIDSCSELHCPKHFRYLFQFVLTLLALLLWPTNGLGSWRHCRVFMEYTRSLISSNILRSGAKEKNEDENCEYEMIWDAEGSMHLVKKTSKAPLTRSSERGLSER